MAEAVRQQSRRVRDLRLEEISLVDRPAQRHAVIALRKRGDDALAKVEISRETRERLAETGASMPDGQYPIRNGADLRRAIQSFGRAAPGEKTAVARHIASRARTLGLTSMIPEEGVLADLISRSKSEKEAGMGIDEMKALMDEMDDDEPMVRLLRGMMDKMGMMDQSSADAGKAETVAAAAGGEKQARAEPVEKQADPSDALRLREEVAALRKRLDEHDRIAARAAVAEGLDHLGGDAADRVALADALAAIPDAEQRGRVAGLLKRHAAERSFLTELGVGSDGSSEQPEEAWSSSPEAADRELRKRARKREQGETAEQAYERMMREHPDIAEVAAMTEAEHRAAHA